jgi:hypothetical protein
MVYKFTKISRITLEETISRIDTNDKIYLNRQLGLIPFFGSDTQAERMKDENSQIILHLLILILKSLR